MKLRRKTVITEKKPPLTPTERIERIYKLVMRLKLALPANHAAQGPLTSAMQNLEYSGMMAGQVAGNNNAVPGGVYR
jgi:hypothetical protein